MTRDRVGKLLYHLTSIENLDSIFQNGLQSRSTLVAGGFNDVADADIINSRQQYNLDRYVPFHFFAKSPFDYGVQRSLPEQRLALIAVRRTIAEANDWRIIPRHPLARVGYEILDYADGIEAIDWELIATRDYDDRECKLACMAECLSPNTVLPEKFFSIYLRNRVDRDFVINLANRHGVTCHINISPNMFAGDANV